MRGRGANILRRQTRRLADSPANLVRSLISQDLDVQVQQQRFVGPVRKSQGGDPKVHVYAFSLFMLLRAPTAMRNIRRRIDAPPPDSSIQASRFHRHHIPLVQWLRELKPRLIKSWALLTFL